MKLQQPPPKWEGAKSVSEGWPIRAKMSFARLLIGSRGAFVNYVH